ncbi:MAG: hypothetical protein QOI23_1253, partial [Chloroflexota bacterium]|nr:hypothetical protein [Chloroflexota bacterium]
MSEEEDLELQALQRQLDDAFQSTRPRPAFEDELWLRMQSRRPVWSRIRDGLTGFVAGLREAPAVPAAAVAIALIVVIGAGITLSGLHPGGAGTSATGVNQDGSTKFGPVAPGYGALPQPSLSGQGQVPPNTPAQVSASANQAYLGPVSLTWAGTLDVTATSLPVYRYQEPTPAAATQFATTLGATPTGNPVTGALGSYASGAGIDLVVYGSQSQPAREPTFVLNEVRSASAPTGDPVSEATAYLAAHSLLPEWQYQTAVEKVGVTERVKFLRTFYVPSQGPANLVDDAGDPYGIEVDLVAAQPRVLEFGPLPLTLDVASYPVISSDQAVRAALASSAT